MKRKALKWTRELYRHAGQLDRVIRQSREGGGKVPPLVSQYRKLQAQHPQRQDPLEKPMQDRMHYWRRDIPY